MLRCEYFRKIKEATGLVLEYKISIEWYGLMKGQFLFKHLQHYTKGADVHRLIV